MAQESDTESPILGKRKEHYWGSCQPQGEGWLMDQRTESLLPMVCLEIIQGKEKKELHAREKVSGYMLSSWTSICLAGDEISRSQHHQLLVPNGLWVYMLVGSMFVGKLVWWELGFIICKTVQKIWCRMFYIALIKKLSLTLFNG